MGQYDNSYAISSRQSKEAPSLKQALNPFGSHFICGFGQVDKWRCCCLHIRAMVFLIGAVEIFYMLYMLVLTIYVSYFQNDSAFAPAFSSLRNSSDTFASNDDLADIPTQLALNRPTLSVVICVISVVIGFVVITLSFFGVILNRKTFLLPLLAFQFAALISMSIALIMLTLQGSDLKDRLVEASGGRWNGGPHMFALTMYFIYIDSLVVGILFAVFASIVIGRAYWYLRSMGGVVISRNGVVITGNSRV